jgi:hypothetical protein
MLHIHLNNKTIKKPKELSLVEDENFQVMAKRRIIKILPVVEVDNQLHSSASFLLN